MRRVAIWDLPTRVFHWSLAVLVVLALAIGDDDQGIAFALHANAGYAILLLLGFRLPWGLVRSPRSRFSDFVKSRRAVLAHAKSLVLNFEAPRTVGHNALGGRMIVALLAMVFLTAATGLFAGEERARGPWSCCLAVWRSPPRNPAPIAWGRHLKFGVVTLLYITSKVTTPN